MKTVWEDIKWFVVAALGFSALPLILAFGESDNDRFTIASIVSLGQAAGILGFAMLKNKQFLTWQYMKDIYETQRNRKAISWRDKNLALHILVGRLGLVCVVISTQWVSPAVAAPVFSTNLIFFMFLRHIDGKTPQATMKLGAIGWIIACASVSGVAMTILSEKGEMRFGELVNGGTLLLLLGVVLDAYNVERSVKLIEISKTKNPLSLGITVVGFMHLLIGVVIFPIALREGLDMEPYKTMVAIALATVCLSAAAISSRQGNITTTRLESNIIVQFAEIFGLIWLALVSISTWARFEIERVDWLIMGAGLILLSACLSQANISLRRKVSDLLRFEQSEIKSNDRQVKKV